MIRLKIRTVQDMWRVFVENMKWDQQEDPPKKSVWNRWSDGNVRIFSAVFTVWLSTFKLSFKQTFRWLYKILPKMVKTWSSHPIFDILWSFRKIFEKFTFIWSRKTETYLMISSSACNCIIDNRWIMRCHIFRAL